MKSILIDNPNNATNGNNHVRMILMGKSDVVNIMIDSDNSEDFVFNKQIGTVDLMKIIINGYNSDKERLDKLYNSY